MTDAFPDDTWEQPNAAQSEPNWMGLPDTTEHRTVGARAWCYADREWCYPDNLCWCCDQTKVPSKWAGEHAGAILEVIKEKVTEMRFEASDITVVPDIQLGYEIACDTVLSLLEGRI